MLVLVLVFLCFNVIMVVNAKVYYEEHFYNQIAPVLRYLVVMSDYFILSHENLTWELKMLQFQFRPYELLL